LSDGTVYPLFSIVGDERSVGETDLPGGGAYGSGSGVDSREGNKRVCSREGADSVCSGHAAEVRSEATSGWTRR
jgi:hypothetical protein